MSEVKNKKIYLAGLTCVSCENIIKEEAQSVSGIVKVNASAKTQTAEIEYVGDLPWQALKNKIETLGYQAALRPEDLAKTQTKKASLALDWFIRLARFSAKRYQFWRCFDDRRGGFFVYLFGGGRWSSDFFCG